MRRNSDGSWDIIEVKGSTGVDEVHLSDLAIQRYVLDGAGFRIRKTVLMHVNNEYVRKGAIDPQAFFTLADATDAVNAVLSDIPTAVRRLHKILDLKAAPTVGIGPHCSAPYVCSFTEHCWKHIPDYSIYDLVRIRAKKIAALSDRGILQVHKIPEDFPLSKAQRLQVRCEKTKKVHIDPDGIAEVLGELEYPLYFLDFETINPAIPPYDGLRPYQQMTFQVSIHIQDQEAGPLRHVEYLGDGQSDPRSEMADCLAKSLGSRGTVIAYNAGFEGQCLAGLAATFPKHAKALLSAKKRLWDLGTPFRSSLYVHPKFRGSWSIKVVLPTLVPGMTYKNLTVSNGGEAQLTYLALMGKDLKPAERSRVSRDLRVYCGQDTLAMVRILEKLRAIAC